MKNADYWRGRAIILEEAAQKGADVCVDDIADMFRGAERSVQADLERWYGRFAANNQISLTEARKLLNTSELEEFRWTVEEYVKIAKQEDLSDEWIRKLENASAKFHVSRLEAVQTQIQQHIELLYKSQTDSVESLLKQVAYNSYTYTAYEIQKSIGLGWNITALDEKKLNTLLSKPWTTDKKTFRDRCWEGKADLVSGVQKTLTQGMLRGDGQKKMTEAISKQFGVSRYKAGRLVHTETTYFNAVSSMECYRELGVERVEIIETLDIHTCELCGSMDGKVLPLAQCEPGVTIPPFHPNCRGTTAPAIDEDIIGERAARDEDGEYYTVPSNTTYEQWKAQQDSNAAEKTATEAKKVVANHTSSDTIESKKIGIQFFAKIPEEKFTAYCLNPEKAPNKARAFKSALGYDMSNFNDLIDNISRHIDEGKFVEKGDKGHGMLYEYVMELTGPNGKTANVLTAWIDDNGEKRLTSAYVTKKEATE